MVSEVFSCAIISLGFIFTLQAENRIGRYMGLLQENGESFLSIMSIREGNK